MVKSLLSAPLGESELNIRECRMDYRIRCTNSAELSLFGWSLREFVQGRAEAFKARPQRGGFTADADAKVLRHFKKHPRDHGRFVVVFQESEQGFGVSLKKTRESDRAGHRPETFQITPGI
jgi:hypothetical protein